MVIKITRDEKKPVDQEVINWLSETGVSSG